MQCKKLPLCFVCSISNEFRALPCNLKSIIQSFFNGKSIVVQRNHLIPRLNRWEIFGRRRRLVREPPDRRQHVVAVDMREDRGGDTPERFLHNIHQCKYKIHHFNGKSFISPSPAPPRGRTAAPSLRPQAISQILPRKSHYDWPHYCRLPVRITSW